jgi:phosphoglycolate phosphatase-like HAD superfamily hydrolase
LIGDFQFFSFVGDSHLNVEVGKVAAIATIGVLWGRMKIDELIVN